MRENKKRGTHYKGNEKRKNVIRCKALNRPVFDYEVCSQFSLKTNVNNQKNCVNCIHSF
jgi:hypothetical protein